MNYPTIEQFNQLQKQYYDLAAKVERLDEAEKKRDFTIQDSATKITIAEGLTEATYKEISQLKVEIHQIRAEIKNLKQSTDQQFEALNNKLDRQVAMTKENNATQVEHSGLLSQQAEMFRQHGELLKQILERLV